MSFSQTGCKSVSNHQEAGEVQGLRAQSSARDGIAVFAKHTGRQVAGILDDVSGVHTDLYLCRRLVLHAEMWPSGAYPVDINTLPSLPNALPTSRVTTRALTRKSSVFGML